MAAGLAVSPVVSGLVLTGFGRHALFALPLALAVLLLAVGFFRLREVGPRGTGAVDPLSVVLGLLGLGALVYGLGEVFRDPLPSLAVLAAGVAVLGLFAWRQLVLKDPLLNLRPLGNLGHAVGELLVMLGMMASFSLSILLPLYYEGALGLLRAPRGRAAGRAGAGERAVRRRGRAAALTDGASGPSCPAASP